MNENIRMPPAAGYSRHAGRMVARLVKSYLRPYFRQLAAAMGFMLLSSAMTAAFAKLVEPVLDNVLVGGKEALIFPMAIAVLLVFVLNGLATYFHTILMNTIGQSIVSDVQKEMFSRFMDLDLRFFHDNPSGQLLARIVSDVNVMRAAVSDSLTGLGKNLLTLVFLIGVMFVQDTRLALIAFCVFPPAAVFVVYLGRRLRKVSKSVQGEIAGLSGMLSQTLQGIRQVKAYGMEDFERVRAGTAVDKVKNLLFKAFRIGNLSTPVNEALLGLALMGVILYGGHEVTSGRLTVGSLMSFIAAFALAYEPLKKLAKLNNSLQMGLGAADRVFDMIDRRPEIVDSASAATLKSAHPSIRFEHVVFSYGNDGQDALNDLTFEVSRGQVTALVGPSGSGKTTAMNLVPRLYDVKSGRVTVDGHDIRELTIESLRRHIALVSQDITIFDDTVRANIAYSRPEATDAEIEEAAKAAAADDFIRAMPDGYSTRLGENGVRLSGGQRQRIAIARAILRDAPILLLDEATSALDTESERLIRSSLERLQKGRTTLVIAHRLSTVQHADKIAVLDAGRVVEQGRHDELIAANGVYAKLYNNGLNS